MNNDHIERIENLFNPDILRPSLIFYSLFLMSFEITKQTIIEYPKTFFTTGFDENGYIISDKYNEEVLSKNKSIQHASLYWFKNLGAINQADIDLFTEIKAKRNQIAHTLQQLIQDDNTQEFMIYFDKNIYLCNKISRWWISEIEIPTNPDFDGEDIDPDDIMPGSTTLLSMITQIALGDKKESMSYFNAIQKMKGKD